MDGFPQGLGIWAPCSFSRGCLPSPPTRCPCFLFPQVTIVEKADSCSVLPSPLSISTRNRMTFLFANLKDRDFLVQRISDFLQQTTSRIYSDKEFSGSCNSSDDEVGGRHLSIVGLLLCSPEHSGVSPDVGHLFVQLVWLSNLTAVLSPKCQRSISAGSSSVIRNWNLIIALWSSSGSQLS